MTRPRFAGETGAGAEYGGGGHVDTRSDALQHATRKDHRVIRTERPDHRSKTTQQWATPTEAGASPDARGGRDRRECRRPDDRWRKTVIISPICHSPDTETLRVQRHDRRQHAEHHHVQRDGDHDERQARHIAQDAAPAPGSPDRIGEGRFHADQALPDRRRRGSRLSRSASPSRLMASTVRKMHRPGNSDIHHDVEIYGAAHRTASRPRWECGGGTPRPREAESGLGQDRRGHGQKCRMIRAIASGWARLLPRDDACMPGAERAGGHDEFMLLQAERVGARHAGQ